MSNRNMKYLSIIVCTLCLIGCGGSTDTNPFAPVTSSPIEQITAPVADDQTEPEPITSPEPVVAPVTTPEPNTEPEMTEEVQEVTEVFEQEEVTTYATIDPFLDKSLGCFLDGELIQTLTIRSDGLYVSQVQGGTYSVQENAWSTGEGVIYLQGRPAQTYTIGDRKLTRENASGVIECVEYVVEEQVEVKTFEDYFGQFWVCQMNGNDYKFGIVFQSSTYTPYDFINGEWVAGLRDQRNYAYSRNGNTVDTGLAELGVYEFDGEKLTSEEFGCLILN